MKEKPASEHKSCRCQADPCRPAVSSPEEAIVPTTPMAWPSLAGKSYDPQNLDRLIGRSAKDSVICVSGKPAGATHIR